MIKNKKIMLVLLLIIAYLIISVLLPYFVKVNLVCVLYLIQSILIPIFATRFLISDVKSFYHSSSRAIGPLIGVLSGLIPTTVMILVPIIPLCLNIGKRTDLNSKLTFATFVFAGIVTWLGLIILSAIAGYLTAVRFSKNDDNLQGHDI
jgi:hypothetical protein